MIAKQTYVEIYKTVLPSGERPSHLPSDTKLVPFELRMKGHLVQPAEIGDMVEIITATHRKETGILIQAKPYYKHDFGHFVDIIDEMKQIILKETEDLL